MPQNNDYHYLLWQLGSNAPQVPIKSYPSHFKPTPYSRLKGWPWERFHWPQPPISYPVAQWEVRTWMWVTGKIVYVCDSISLLFLPPPRTLKACQPWLEGSSCLQEAGEQKEGEIEWIACRHYWIKSNIQVHTRQIFWTAAADMVHIS